jgi:hypothetical protein
VLLENKTIMLYCDNKATINIANNPIQHDRIKHVEIDRHFIKDKLDEAIVCLSFIGTKEQIADVFTKGLSVTDISNVVRQDEHDKYLCIILKGVLNVIV